MRATSPRVDEIVAGSTYLPTADVTRPEDLQRLLQARHGVRAVYFAPPAVTAKARAALWVTGWVVPWVLGRS